MTNRGNNSQPSRFPRELPRAKDCNKAEVVRSFWRVKCRQPAAKAASNLDDMGGPLRAELLPRVSSYRDWRVTLEQQT